MRRSRLILGVAVIGVLGWWLFSRSDNGDDTDSKKAAAGSDRIATPSPTAAARAKALRSGHAAWGINNDDGDGVTVSGTIIDAQDHKPVGNVEVVFRSALGESTAQAAADGTYSIKVASVSRVRTRRLGPVGGSAGRRAPARHARGRHGRHARRRLDAARGRAQR